MSSLMDIVLRSLPFAALDHTLRAGDSSAAVPALIDAAGADLSGHLEFLPPGAARIVNPPRPSPGASSGSLQTDLQKNAPFEIWGYSAGSKPEELSDVTCRVWSESYDQYVVLDALRFGYEEPPSESGSSSAKPLKPLVRATRTDKALIELPLTTEFLKQQWLVQNVTLPEECGDPLWKLRTPIDKALVRVFVYELLGDATTPIPLEGEDAEKASFAEVDAACESMASATIPDGAAQKLFADTTFFPDDLASGVCAETGGSAGSEQKRNRIVVILSWTLCKATCDFAPGGAIPMGRIYPHALIVANASYGSFEVSLQFDRPTRTNNKDNPGECCKSAAGEMLTDISSVIITEANYDESFVTAAPVPIWCNLFTYYAVAPSAASSEPATDPRSPAEPVPIRGSLNLTRMRMVRNDRPDARWAPATYVTRMLWGSTATALRKLARQGEFDNIHMAPPMQCPQIASLANTLQLFPTPIAQAPEIQASLQKIWMAPFCAHDCFHLHWRWTDNFAEAPPGGPQFLGWGPDGPQSADHGAGACMAPMNQSVDLWYRSASTFTYHAFMGNHAHNGLYAGAETPEARTDIPPGELQVVCYHGAAYGLNAEYWLGWLITSGLGLANQLDGVKFFDAQGWPVTSATSWALFYWRLRYDAEWDPGADKFQLYKRTTFQDLEAARKL